jgi:glycosyltransferase involved in cell wall biosynthesis
VALLYPDSVSNLRILHYAPPLHLPGGIRTYVLGMAAAQIERGLDVVVAAPAPRPGDDALQESLAEAVRSIRPDVVHLHGRDVLDASDWPDLPVVNTIHGHELYCPAGTKWSPSLGACGITPGLVKCSATMLRHKCGSRRPQKVVENFTRYYALRTQRRTTHQHCVSRYVADRMGESGYAPGGGTSVIYAPVSRPVDVETSSAGRDYDLLFAGRLSPNKGVDVAVRALALSTVRPRMAIAGEGPELANLVRLAEELGVSGQIDFLGWRAHEDIVQLHSAQTVLLTPSQWPDPAPLVAAEAAARGRVCLVSDRGGLPELVPHPDQVVADQEPETWARTIDQALSDQGWMTDRGRDAKALWARSFDPDVVVPAFTEVYESMTS